MVKETELKTALGGSTLGDFLISNPNCRIIINASRPIKKWESGDVRIIGGRTKVKRQRMSDGCYVTRRGRLVHDWVELDDTTQSMIPNPVPPKPRFSRGQRIIILLDGQHEAITGSSILLEHGWYTSVTPLGKEAIQLPEQLLINYYDRDW